LIIVIAVEIENFINLGYGWVCRRCSERDAAHPSPFGTLSRARYYTEGESEQKNPRLETAGLARWRDSKREYLMCPTCGIEERLDTSAI